MTTLDLSAFEFSKDPLVDREAKRVIELAYQTGIYVVPPKIVDLAIHKAMDRGELDRIGEIAGRPLRHEVGIRGQRKYRLYAKGYAAYPSYFGEQPPADIWAAPACCGMIVARSDEAKQPAACGMIAA